jgi:hypothetical protein
VSEPLYDKADIKRPQSFFDTRKSSKKPIPQDMLDELAKQSGAKTILQKRGACSGFGKSAARSKKTVYSKIPCESNN